MKTVAIPDSVTSLNYSVFEGCNFESLTIPKTLTGFIADLGDSDFISSLGYCSINTIILEDGTTAIYEDEFAFCSFENIIIPNSVTYIDLDNFENFNFTGYTFTVYTHPGSCADEFAKSYNITVKYLVPEDINWDRTVNMQDIVLAASHFNTTSSGSDYDIKCDLNNDKVINMIDIMMIVAKFNYKY